MKPQQDGKHKSSEGTEDTQGSERKGANGEARRTQRQGAGRTEPGKHRREAQRVGKQKGKREA